MEEVDGLKILQSSQLHSKSTIHEFLNYYSEYRANCLPKNPWVPAPASFDSQETLTKTWQLASQRHPNDSRRQETDIKLTQTATTLLSQIYTHIPLEFMRGHFSVED